jgi:SAM-dependent methyltransferase
MNERPGPSGDDEILASGWRVAGPAGGSLPRRLLHALRGALAVLLRPQETFNAAVARRLAALDDLSRARADEAMRAAGEARSTAEAAADSARDAASWSEAALEQSLRIREAFEARERRHDDALSAVLEAQQELRTQVGVLQHAAQSLKRELAGGARPPAPAPGASAPPATAPVPAGDALDHRYVGFEDQFRGDPEAVRERLLDYAPLFDGAADVLDLGCGRGEFLALLEERGVTARGIDVNQAMVDVCRERGLHAHAGDALAYLAAQPDASLGGLFSAQVVEHLDPGYLGRLLDASFDKLRPGAPIVLETINPACWFAFFDSYIRDLSHVRPIHPDTLRYLLVASGFQGVEIRYRAPYPEHEKLQPLPAGAAPGGTGLAETFNANVERLNSLLFTYLDYAAIGRRA